MSIEFRDFKRVLDNLDVNSDGKISPAELQSFIMRTIGKELSREDAEALVEFIGSDGTDGLLGFEEFIKLVGMESNEEEKKERELREAFRMYEMEGEGCITAKSLKRMLSRLGLSRDIEDCKVMICRFDLNGDGVLSLEEFRVMMML